jgi:hypothetical protein
MMHENGGCSRMNDDDFKSVFIGGKRYVYARNSSVAEEKYEYVVGAVIKKKIKHKIDYKTRAIEHYTGGSMCCAHCGIGDIRVLDLHHLNYDGKTHRKGSNIYRQVVQEGFPEGMRVLCANCHRIEHLS